MSRSARGAALVLTMFLSACTEPPIKEMSQAQGAIDAARAAGAEQYATQEFRAAADALQRSEQAVTQKDYRLALSLAIDGRERAQLAAKTAVEARAKARGDAERVIAQVNARLTQALDRLKNPTAARLSRRVLDSSSQTLDAAQRNMQEASAALAQHDYARALQLANEAAAAVQQVLATIEKTTIVPASRPRR